MKHANGIGRLAGLAVGLGIGAAVASTPGVAWADELDFQISIDGYDLIPAADTTATATAPTVNAPARERFRGAGSGGPPWPPAKGP